MNLPSLLNEVRAHLKTLACALHQLTRWYTPQAALCKMVCMSLQQILTSDGLTCVTNTRRLVKVAVSGSCRTYTTSVVRKDCAGTQW